MELASAAPCTARSESEVEVTLLWMFCRLELWNTLQPKQKASNFKTLITFCFKALPQTSKFLFQPTCCSDKPQGMLASCFFMETNRTKQKPYVVQVQQATFKDESHCHAGYPNTSKVLAEERNTWHRRAFSSKKQTKPTTLFPLRIDFRTKIITNTGRNG